MACDHDILTISDVATHLEMAEKIVYRLAQAGDLSAFKVDHDQRFRRVAIDFSV